MEYIIYKKYGVTKFNYELSYRNTSMNPYAMRPFGLPISHFIRFPNNSYVAKRFHRKRTRLLCKICNSRNGMSDCV